MLKARRRGREERTENKSNCSTWILFCSFRLYPNVSYSFRVFCLTRFSIFNGCKSRRLPATTSIVRMRTFEKSSKTMKMQFRLVYFWVNTCKTSYWNQLNKQVQHSTCLRCSFDFFSSRQRSPTECLF